MAELTHYHLTHRNDEWRLEKEGNDRATLKAPTKKEAIEKTRAKVKGTGASVTVHRMDGSVQEEWTYPRDEDSKATKKTSRSESAKGKGQAKKAKAKGRAEKAKKAKEAGKAKKAKVQAEKAKVQSEEVKEQAKEQAGALAEEAKQQAQGQLAAQKTRATDGLCSLSTALQEASSQLREEDQDALARYTDTAAEQLGQFAELLRERSVGELLREAERYARREPALFLGGAVVLGFFGGRFLRSSRPGRSRYHEPR